MLCDWFTEHLFIRVIVGDVMIFIKVFCWSPWTIYLAILNLFATRKLLVRLRLFKHKHKDNDKDKDKAYLCPC